MTVRRGDEFGYLDRETMRWITVGKVDGVEIEEELSGYYFDADDPELEAVNCLRRLVGMRDQLPKHYEAELQADEAETPEDGEDT